MITDEMKEDILILNSVLLESDFPHAPIIIKIWVINYFCYNSYCNQCQFTSIFSLSKISLLLHSWKCETIFDPIICGIWIEVRHMYWSIWKIDVLHLLGRCCHSCLTQVRAQDWVWLDRVYKDVSVCKLLSNPNKTGCFLTVITCFKHL